MVGFDAVTVPPPIGVPVDEKPEEEALHTSSLSLLPVQAAVFTLTVEQARSALLSFVSSHCCYGTGAAKQMRITSMEYVPAHHYELQTFTERRETCWTYAPHKGDTGHTDGPAPLPWDINEKPVAMFKDDVRLVPVPNTGVVKSCHKCRGTGGMTCGDCTGKVRLELSLLLYHIFLNTGMGEMPALSW